VIKTEPLTKTKLFTETQQLTSIHHFPPLEPLNSSAVPTFTELLAEYTASLSKPKEAWNHLINDESADPFAVYQRNLANVRPQPVRWLWQDRLPLAGITLLDGDHSCGKSLLALQIAAHVSSGTSLPDGSPTIQGGVIIITPHTDSTTTQLQLLTALGADLSRIEILSFIQETVPESHTSSYRPFSLPEDSTRLFEAIQRVDARLVIFDPFIHLLSQKQRITNRHLYHLLANLNLQLIERNVTCLLLRNCHAKGGRARPSTLEKSDHFLTIAVNHLLLAPDPMQPDRLLLSHALSRHTALTPTLTLQIQSLPDNPKLPHITIQGPHTLPARDLLSHRPATLHRRLLAQHLLAIIAAAPDPISVATLYSLSPHSGPFQIQRALSDLLHMGQIQRSSRGHYTLKSTTTITPTPGPANQLESTATITPNANATNHFKSSATITPNADAPNHFKSSAAITPNANAKNELKPTATITPNANATNELKPTATITPNAGPKNELKPTATITPNADAPNHLKPTATITPNANGTNELKSSATITPNANGTNELKSSATITPNANGTNQLKTPAAITPNPNGTNQLKPTATTTSNLRPHRPRKRSNKRKNAKKRR
jgi:AAA domain